MDQKNTQREEVAQLIDDLYNQLATEGDSKTTEIRESLLKAYRHLDRKSPEVTANHLANYLRFTGYTEKIVYTQAQDELISQLSQLGQSAGLNGSYKTAYGDKSQF
ncbi:bacteriocin immunity protein [Lacticaseibacillus pantheris]